MTKIVLEFYRELNVKKCCYSFKKQLALFCRLYSKLGKKFTTINFPGICGELNVEQESLSLFISKNMWIIWSLPNEECSRNLTIIINCLFM